MDGIVVIGEGEKDEAPMLYNGERIGDGTPHAHRHRRRPDRRHHAHRARSGQRHRRRSRCPSGAPCSTPVRASTWRRSPSGPTAAASSTSTLPATDNLEALAKAKGTSRPRHHRGDPRPAPPRRADRRGAVDGRAHQADPRRRRRRCHLDGVARVGRRHPVRHRRHARRRDHRRRAQVHGRRDAGPPVAAQRRRARTRRSPPATTSTGCSPPTIW